MSLGDLCFTAMRNSKDGGGVPVSRRVAESGSRKFVRVGARIIRDRVPSLAQFLRLKNKSSLERASGRLN